ncbi:MAG: HEAT repeat domain-containing protein [Verrucomicrobia bacterium]|nr:HEAT repeat domain-containing protein [Verrucomicrobiota bacterium]MBI3868098.1 HEAT repeat domain-containing protein [Verrucomicrobiota bacterium]
MNAFIPRLNAAALLAFSIASLSAAELRDEHERSAALLAPKGEGAARRQYAPSREVDILHLKLDVTPDFRLRSIQGTAVMTFKPIAMPLAEFKLDAVKLRVSDVSSTETLLGWQVTETQLVLTFQTPIAAGNEASVTIRYAATPEAGLYFRTPELGYPAEDEHLWSQGEPTESRQWFPSFDSPNEKFTSEMICRVPDGMVVLSNGRQMSSDLDPATGLRAFRWLQDKPHSNYLIALVAGRLKSVEAKHRDIPLALYCPASQVAFAKNTFEGTQDMMAFFEEEIGVPYPWDKYYQAAVSDYHWGGMENTTLTVLNETTLHPDGYETLRSSEGLVAHELAHQWFGDLVTCKDWSHLWLNEGFATYYDALYEGHKHGRDHLLYAMRQNAEGVLNAGDDRTPIVYRGFAHPEEQFGYRAYPKGAWILHMLRNQLGEPLYRKCVQTYLERHKFGNVDTEDLARVIEELSGRSFDAFFDQYVYHGQQPDLKIRYQWMEREKLVKLSIVQQQTVSDEVLLFTVPAKARFKGKFGTIDREFQIHEKSEDFSFTLPSAPEIVRFDPDYALLAKVSFDLPGPMVRAQLGDASDMIGRLLATQQLSHDHDDDAVRLLGKALKSDSFYGVRLAASRALRQIDTPAARDALAAAVAQEDARVRQQVLSDLMEPYSEASLGRALETLKNEKNPDIVATAIYRLQAYARPEIHAILLRYLEADSYRGQWTQAALEAMEGQQDPGYLEPILAAVRAHESQWRTSLRVQAISALGSLGRLQENKDGPRDYLMKQLDDPRDRVQRAAIRSLGTLGDPKALGALQRFTTLAKANPVRSAAEKSISDLRAAKRPTVEFGDVRNEVLSLQQENKDLRRDLDALKKKLESMSEIRSAADPAEAKKGAAKKPGAAASKGTR